MQISQTLQVSKEPGNTELTLTSASFALPSQDPNSYNMPQLAWFLLPSRCFFFFSQLEITVESQWGIHLSCLYLSWKAGSHLCSHSICCKGCFMWIPHHSGELPCLLGYHHRSGLSQLTQAAASTAQRNVFRLLLLAILSAALIHALQPGNIAAALPQPG